MPLSWSPDGQTLIFKEFNPKTGLDLWLLPLTGDRVPRPYLVTPFNEGLATVSPDGHWLAYVSDESGRREMYVRSFPAGGGKWQISTQGGAAPLWARNGRELFFRSGEAVLAVDVTTKPGFSLGKARLLFEGRYLREPDGIDYDVTADGQRFLMIKPSEGELAATRFNVVLNWSEELKARVPSAR